MLVYKNKSEVCIFSYTKGKIFLGWLRELYAKKGRIFDWVDDFMGLE